MKEKLNQGDTLTCIEYNHTEYWKKGLVTPVAPLTLNGDKITPTSISQWDVTGESELATSSPSIFDANQVAYGPGPRPRNIVRRR
jgi:hypothetical protein